MQPHQRAQARLLMEHARSFKGVAEVPDPYYGGPEGFERVLDLVEDACEGMVEQIRRQQRTA
jgi:protein-tyrosine phosphatase